MALCSEILMVDMMTITAPPNGSSIQKPGIALSQRENGGGEGNKGPKTEKQHLHQRHPMCAVKTPAIIGPVMDPTGIMDMTRDVESGRMLGAQTQLMMSMQPLNWPAAPSPFMARPTMKTWLDFAMAQTTRPTSKTTIKAR